MKRHLIRKFLSQFCLTSALLLLAGATSFATELTQRDWMVSLVDAAGWSFGLPDEPQDHDYINILNGNRDLRFEAEDCYDVERDSVSLMAFRNFGEFSGTGWLNGSRQPSDVHLNFTLPVDGNYLLQAQLRREGHTVKVGGKEIRVDAEQKFTRVDIGELFMQAGPQEIIVTLPPGGSIDYITLRATNLPAITPADGWQPEEPLGWEVVQTTMLQLMQLAELFPLETEALHFEAEDLKKTSAKVVDIPHLGVPSKGKWLRAGPAQVEITFPLELSSSGFYDLALRVMGAPTVVTIGGHETIRIEAKAYLDDYSFKPFFLFAGKNNISVSIPPGGGVDWLSLTGRKVDGATTRTLLGIDQSSPPTPTEIDTLTSQLAAFGINR